MRRTANIEGKSQLAKIILPLNLFRCAIAKIENSSWSGRLIFRAAQCNPSVAGASEMEQRDSHSRPLAGEI
ncbi:MAG: hypothetical protein DME79_08160 [Verrucomicrobia bacterium]|nr:MAG: hypothetical protein DMC60_09525 [Verrucomicrobiota bacterium]PYJ32710.1 MAG: hypothetical protein DME79_08160 [Verrucomicrobiota bacterium]